MNRQIWLTRDIWPVLLAGNVPGRFQLAPFHLLASEGQVHTDRDHSWHMNMGARLSQVDPALFKATQHVVVDLTAPDEIDATRWWEDLTGNGGESMVVKPLTSLPPASGAWCSPP